MVCKVTRNGTRYWYQNGKLHRLDGPAVVTANDTKVWYQDGKLHRIDGPAVEYANGDKEYWINEIHLTKQEWKKQHGV